MKLSEEEQKQLQTDLEERADYISDEELRELTAKNEFFLSVQKKITGRGTKLIVGPRGCGKTHMLRFAQLECVRNKRAPFAAYVSFNRYYRLEPMLQSKPDARRLFQVWLLANTILAAVKAVADFAQGDPEGDARKFASTIGIEPETLRTLIARLEVSLTLDPEHEALANRLTVSGTTEVLEEARQFSGRHRAILLLDDAALTLTPDYLAEFFDVVRAIKTATISPKASIYPGTTEYGPRFHAVHEAEEVPVWLAPDDPSYEQTMKAIAELRFPSLGEAPVGVTEQLQFAAFGIPRAYLAMLRQFMLTRVKLGTQAALNRTIEDHMNARIAEFQSLAQKVPKFEALVRVGQIFFDSAVDLLAKENRDSETTKQLMLGLLDEPARPLVGRMLGLLVEAGLIFEHQSVAHGRDHDGTSTSARRYRRFTPHLGSMMQQRAFSGGSKGVSPGRVVEHLRRKSAKHPLRRSVDTILTNDQVGQIEPALSRSPRCRSI